VIRPGGLMIGATRCQRVRDWSAGVSARPGTLPVAHAPDRIRPGGTGRAPTARLDADVRNVSRSQTLDLGSNRSRRREISSWRADCWRDRARMRASARTDAVRNKPHLVGRDTRCDLTGSYSQSSAHREGRFTRDAVRSAFRQSENGRAYGEACAATA
jgi:hypothetical protein